MRIIKTNKICTYISRAHVTTGGISCIICNCFVGIDFIYCKVLCIADEKKGENKNYKMLLCEKKSDYKTYKELINIDI